MMKMQQRIFIPGKDLAIKEEVLYLNFKKPSHADDSELTDNDMIIRYEIDEVAAITLLNSKN
jgi:hypothetical protein